MDIKQALSDIAPLAAGLDAQDNLISRKITMIERELRERVSVRLEIELPDGQFLAFGKIQKDWCLIVSGENYEIALLSCTRQRRAAMLAEGHIERLVKDAASQIEGLIEVRRRALASADRLLSDLVPSEA